MSADPRVEPGLVDLQVNGYAGHDVNADDVTPDTLADLTRALWGRGVTTYLPTVITASEEKILHVLSVIAAARREDPLLAHSIAGVHVEGPSLATEDGPRGAHDIAHLRDPDVAELDRWQQAAEGAVRLVTLAPERAGAAPYIAAASARGVRISLGHCAPSPQQVRAGVEAGATLSTHLGNGAASMLPRHPNHLWTQLADDRLTAMLIADGHHLPADTLTVMIRAKGPERCVLTSDSAALAGMPPGRYRTPVGGDVEVAADGRLTLAGTEYLAGSGSDLRTCMNWARAALPIDPATLGDMASRIPASLLGLEGRTAAGGDSVLVEDDQVIETRVAGTVVHRA
ncbi:N-acetylglucosamine-6-phosphate deacetylase [Brachybacterium sp. UMB0905]|uniref:N-acetylglucosamine-6-phosphate deacetylase n=1 Tax=Brachybacterium sp. UMB0905 TaxID=2069310 RepID=UPI000C7FF341|nr:amidohydrolase family protein [Brachybacterium sp. UMB0905]PMC74766.1 N-acetylglucosamine-6-phosphate deacetylase [Brachybacterium sp. UMB0905]